MVEVEDRSVAVQKGKYPEVPKGGITYPDATEMVGVNPPDDWRGDVAETDVTEPVEHSPVTKVPDAFAFTQGRLEEAREGIVTDEEETKGFIIVELEKIQGMIGRIVCAATIANKDRKEMMESIIRIIIFRGK
jgi:hypothetical protein